MVVEVEIVCVCLSEGLVFEGVLEERSAEVGLNKREELLLGMLLLALKVYSCHQLDNLNYKGQISIVNYNHIICQY